MRHDSDTILDALLYTLFMVFVGALVILPLSCRDTGREEGRCAERWKYQRTQFDTLQTIRSGCKEPERK